MSSSEQPTSEDTDASKSAQYVSRFSVPKMDCPSEERMIRLALETIAGWHGIHCDLDKRTVDVFHDGPIAPITERLAGLGLGAVLTETRETQTDDLTRLRATTKDDAAEARTLRILLVINGAMFGLELIAGLLAQSAGLIADSLDMFADAAVYGVALGAVGRGGAAKVRAARVAGILQLTMAIGLLFEVGRRVLFGSDPLSALMILIGLLALSANVLCLMLIHRYRDGGVHMKASWIFSANDVLANIGVIVAGLLVCYSGSRYPDLIIGTLIGLVVLLGAFRIMRLKS